MPPEALTANQIESVTTILTKQRYGLTKFAKTDGRAKEVATILDAALQVLASDFYAPEAPEADATGVATHEDAAAEDFGVDPDDLPFE
jgi:hypothetical protein